MPEKPEKQGHRAKVLVDRQADEIRRKKRMDKIIGYFVLVCITLVISYVVAKVLH